MLIMHHEGAHARGFARNQFTQDAAIGKQPEDFLGDYWFSHHLVHFFFQSEDVFT